ncbi:MAG: CPBP family intramembrane glutamic endopeptidase [Terriglobia bacterium]
MRILTTAFKVYLGLSLISLAWIKIQNRLAPTLFFIESWENVPRLVFAVLGATALLIGLFHVSARHFSWGRQLELELSRILVPLPLREIAVISLLSGFAEELFFRGACQPVIGLIPASVLFGVAHLVPRSPLWPWSLQAFFAGFLLGSIYELTHQLVPVMVIHSLTNFVLIVLMNRRYSPQVQAL